MSIALYPAPDHSQSSGLDCPVLSLGYGNGGDEGSPAPYFPVFFWRAHAWFQPGSSFYWWLCGWGDRKKSPVKAGSGLASLPWVDGALFQGFLAAGLERTGAGLGSVMIDSQPLAVALMARWLFNEFVGALGWIGLLWGILGISLLGLPDEWILSLLHGNADWLLEGHPLDVLLQGGEWLMLLAALSMAIGTILINYVSRHADPVCSNGMAYGSRWASPLRCIWAVGNPAMAKPEYG